MKKMLWNIGGLVLFYSIIIFGVILLNLRFQYLNNYYAENNINTVAN